MDKVAGIALAGGQGLRARPLTLEVPGYLRSKAAMWFAGRPVIEWQVKTLHRQGIDDFYLIANGRENRYQPKEILGNGEGLGVRVRYSRPRMDWRNTGSGEATLRGLAHWNLDGLALVFPTDSLFDLDLAALVRGHQESGALVTVAVTERPAEEVAGKYGTVVTDDAGRVRTFMEKPALSQVLGLFADPARVPVNSGLYLIDCGRLRALAGEPALAQMTRRRLDWGHDLLPWLVNSGYPVRVAPIRKLGDLGNLRDYLDTMADALSGGYPGLLDGEQRICPGNLRIHGSSLRQRDPVSGMTLAEKMSAGLVRIGPNVQIGREVEIGPGVVLRDTHVGDGVDLHTGCSLRRVSCLDGAIVGPHAQVSDSHVGVMARVESSADTPTVLSEFTALGNGAVVQAGARLRGVTVYPNLTVPAYCRAPAGTSLETADSMAGQISTQDA